MQQTKNILNDTEMEMEKVLMWFLIHHSSRYDPYEVNVFFLRISELTLFLLLASYQIAHVYSKMFTFASLTNLKYLKVINSKVLFNVLDRYITPHIEIMPTCRDIQIKQLTNINVTLFSNV